MVIMATLLRGTHELSFAILVRSEAFPSLSIPEAVSA